MHLEKQVHLVYVDQTTPQGDDDVFEYEVIGLPIDQWVRIRKVGPAADARWTIIREVRGFLQTPFGEYRTADEALRALEELEVRNSSSC